MPSKHATASGSDILPAEPMVEAASLPCPRPPGPYQIALQRRHDLDTLKPTLSTNHSQAGGEQAFPHNRLDRTITAAWLMGNECILGSSECPLIKSICGNTHLREKQRSEGLS